MSFADRWEETSRRLTALIEPQLAPGEALSGVLHALQPRLFSADLFAVGVTPERLILQPIDRDLNASAPATTVSRDGLTESSVWGWGGSVADFLSASAGQQLRFAAGGTKYKLVALGGNALEDALSGPTQRAGVQALVAFLLSPRREA
jgi:hypothetical protein